jgi:hypothetical protein
MEYAYKICTKILNKSLQQDTDKLLVEAYSQEVKLITKLSGVLLGVIKHPGLCLSAETYFVVLYRYIVISPIVIEQELPQPQLAK